MSQCVICNQPIPEGRLKAMPGIQTCIQHSGTQPYGVVNIINHKTGNEIQILPNRESARLLNIMSQRKGYGVSRGVKGTYKR